MGVQRLVCPDCGFEVPFSVVGSKGSYRTASEFTQSCRQSLPAGRLDAMDCPALRAEAERVLNRKLLAEGAAPGP